MSSSAKAESSAESSVRRAPARAGSRRAEASWLLVALLSLAAGAVLFLSRERGRTDSTARPEVAIEHEPPAEEPAAPADRSRIEPPSIAERLPARVAAVDTSAPAEPAPRTEPATTPEPAPAARIAVLEIHVHSSGVPTPATIELGYTEPGSEHETVTRHASDEHGRLHLELLPGSVRAVGWSERASALPAFAELAAGARTELPLELEPAHAVAGRVIDARTGMPIAGAAVSFWTFSELDRAFTAADGTFEHPRFPARAPAQQMRVEAPGYGPAVRYLAIEADVWQLFPRIAGEPALAGGGTPWLEIALAPELHVEGRVLDPEGRPLAGAAVEAEGFYHVRPAVASRDQASTRSDEGGRFRLAGLRSDVGHSLLVRASGFALLELELSGGPQLDVGELSLARETVLSGVVLDAGGLPVEDIAVVLRPAGLVDGSAPAGELDTGVRLQGREVVARTGPEGAFLFENLALHPYELAVRRDADPWIERTLLPLDGRFEELVLQLPLGALTLEGTVRDEHGPAANVAVELKRFGLVARTTTGPDGGFRIAGLDAQAAYAIEATRAGNGVVWGSSASSWAHERPLLELESSSPGLAQVLAR